MRRRIAFLLPFFLLFSLFITACGSVGNDANPSVPDESDLNSEGKSEVSNPFAWRKLVLTDTPVAENSKSTVISRGASYVKSAEAEYQYPDTYGTELTDGITGVAKNSFSDESLSGYTVSKLTVTLDLGTNYDTIYGFEVGFYTTNGAGISMPESFSVYASLDGDNWAPVGTLVKPEPVEGEVSVASLYIDKYVNARYIQFLVVSDSYWMHLDEVSVIADTDSESDVKYLEAVNNAYTELGTVTAPANGNEIDRTLDKVLISKGATYVSDGVQLEKFSDQDNIMLTDGKLSGYYEGGTWVGYEGGKDITVKIDLRKNVDDIASVEASFFVNTSTRIYMPVALKVAAIDNKSNRTELGIVYGNTVLQNGNYCFTLPFSKTVSARYIEVTMLATETAMILVEEIGVYAYRVKDTDDGLYPPLVIEEGATEWGSEGSDEYQNLIKGKTQQIVLDSQVDKELYDSHYNSPVSSELLTDGIYSTENKIHNGKFFKFYLGTGRTVIYDLEHLSSVDKFTASFTHFEDWAVYKPFFLSVIVSDNGVDWYNLGEMKWNTTEADALYKGELVLDKMIAVRYVAFHITVRTWTGCDELEVYGSKNTSNAISPSSAGYTAKDIFVNKRIEPSDDIINGAKDLCLLYYTNQTPAYTVEDLMPYVGYVDEDGVVQDVMFDSFLFLYDAGKFPSGAEPVSGSLMSDWEWCIDHLFTEGTNVLALDEAAGRVKETLGLDSNYKYPVTMALYYPDPAVTDFGDVDGDGISENFSNYEDRVKSVKWFIDKIESKYAEYAFENIEIAGYYWYHEDIAYTDSEIKPLILAVSDYIHSIGRDFIWIPWYTGPGFHLWDEYGFDIACMQPNYVFDARAEYAKIVGCAELTERYGMGIEMEICAEALRNELFFKKYMQYMAGGVEYGYMTDTVNMYYQSVFVYRDAAKSDDVMARTVYDTTYHYIKGDMVYNPPVIENLEFNAEKNTVFTGTIEFADDKLRKLEVSLVADHGSVTVHNDGTFTYYPEKDYTGDVKFSFIYTEYLGWSDPCEVVINVQ